MRRPEEEAVVVRTPLDGESPADRMAQQLVDVADRLCREFAPAGGAGADAVRRQVREARDGFGSPKVIDFLPVLVERDVRHRLSR